VINLGAGFDLFVLEERISIMKSVSELLNNNQGHFLKRNNVNNDNINISKSVINVNNGKTKNKKYALDPLKFTPNTEGSQLANNMAIYFNDLENFAFYMHVVNKLSVSGAYGLWRSVQDEIESKKDDEKRKIRYPRKYFAWKFREGRY
jgi:hypothetical protein